MPDPIEPIRYGGLRGLLCSAAEEAREIHRGMVENSPDEPTVEQRWRKHLCGHIVDSLERLVQASENLEEPHA